MVHFIHIHQLLAAVKFISAVSWGHVTEAGTEFTSESKFHKEYSFEH
jgi:hypothetical protein